MHAIPVVLGRGCLTPNWPFCARDLGPGISDRGPCSWSWGRGLRPRGWAVAIGWGGADAGCCAIGQVARCRARCPASAPAPVITLTGADAASAPVPACAARPKCAADQDAVDYGQRPGDGQELISRRAGHCGLSGGGRRGVWAFSRRLSAVVRRRRSGSILAVSVVPRRRKAPHRDARIAILATAARCRRRLRWPAACHRG